MARTLIVMAGLFGSALLVYNAAQDSLSPHLFGENSWKFLMEWGYMPFAALLFLRLPFVVFLIASFCQSLQWRYYLGATEIRPIWTDDLNPDAP